MTSGTGKLLSDCCRPPTRMSIAASDNEIPDHIVSGSVGWAKGQAVLGSALLEMGSSRVACFVFTPKPAPSRASVDEGLLEVEVCFPSFLDESEVNGEEASKCLADAVHRAVSPAVLFTSVPKCTLSISAVVLRSSNQDAAALINGATLAMMNAMVEIRGLVTACLLPVNAKAKVLVAYLGEDITICETEGLCSPRELQIALGKTAVRCRDLRESLMHQVLPRS